jgi:peptidoglycan/LPS O-acetylase OafA/YrhL
MKSKTALIILVIGTVTMSLGMWAYYSLEGSLQGKDMLLFGVLIVVAVFGIYIGLRRVMSERRGEPGEDELSRRIMQKAGASSFYISLYFWLALSYFISDRDTAPETAIGLGIAGMALIFAFSWMYHRFKGLKD